MTLINYLSPVDEVSLYKGIPMSEYNEQNRKLIRSLIGKQVRFVFRGPRRYDVNRSYYTQRASCIKASAKTFAVYVR